MNIRSMVALALAFGWGACSNDTGFFSIDGEIERPEIIDFGEVFLGASAKRTVEIKVIKDSVRWISVGGIAPELTLLSAPARHDVVFDGDSFFFEFEFRPSALGLFESYIAFESDVGFSRFHFVAEAIEKLACAPRLCASATFDVSTESCVYEALDGVPCDDGNQCTHQSLCVEGACLGEAVLCDDGVACTQNTCAPDRGCFFAKDNSVCPSTSPCEVGLCTDSGCSTEVLPDYTPCGPSDCSSANVCFGGECESFDVRAFSDGEACDDGRLCTVDDECLGGECVGGEELPLDWEVVYEERSYWSGGQLDCKGDLCAFAEVGEHGSEWYPEPYLDCPKVLVGALGHLGNFSPEFELSCASSIASTEGLWVLYQDEDGVERVAFFQLEDGHAVSVDELELTPLSIESDRWEIETAFANTLFIRSSETGLRRRVHFSAIESTLSLNTIDAFGKLKIVGEFNLVQRSLGGELYFQDFDDAGSVLREVQILLPPECRSRLNEIVFREPLLLFSSWLPYTVCVADLAETTDVVWAEPVPLNVLEGERDDVREHLGTWLHSGTLGEVVATVHLDLRPGNFGFSDFALAFNTEDLFEESGFITRSLGLTGALTGGQETGHYQSFLHNFPSLSFTTHNGRAEALSVANAIAVTNGRFLGERFYAGVREGELYFDLEEQVWRNEQAVEANSNPWFSTLSFFNPSPAGWLLSDGAHPGERSYGVDEASLFSAGEEFGTYATYSEPGYLFYQDVLGHPDGAVWTLLRPNFYPPPYEETEVLRVSLFDVADRDVSEVEEKFIEFLGVRSAILASVDARGAWVLLNTNTYSRPDMMHLQEAPVYQRIERDDEGGLILGPSYTLDSELEVAPGHWMDALVTEWGVIDIQYVLGEGPEFPSRSILRTREFEGNELRLVNEINLGLGFGWDDYLIWSIENIQGEEGFWLHGRRSPLDDGIPIALNYFHRMPDGTLHASEGLNLVSNSDRKRRYFREHLFGIYPVPGKDEALVLSEDGVYHLRGYCAE